MSLPGVGCTGWCRMVPWTKEPGLCDPRRPVSQTPLVQGVVSLLRPLLPPHPPPPSCILPTSTVNSPQK